MNERVSSSINMNTYIENHHKFHGASIEWECYRIIQTRADHFDLFLKVQCFNSVLQALTLQSPFLFYSYWIITSTMLINQTKDAVNFELTHKLTQNSVIQFHFDTKQLILHANEFKIQIVHLFCCRLFQKRNLCRKFDKACFNFESTIGKQTQTPTF